MMRISDATLMKVITISAKSTDPLTDEELAEISGLDGKGLSNILETHTDQIAHYRKPKGGQPFIIDDQMFSPNREEDDD
ncbi:hypothetical protein AEAC466_19155 [Asticcacaulis sp. AC466]|uniref:hypothetical protein n=1 Tax=Asticcacaulis sp. AC466 TaxID=1282362 RepID=UPI0003C402E5|nr:hypothetical protein [Asticcacaulis sp. AC466]ESQ82038.1 hypothetical protein AEAC466_19155 [Asticcacaulis sp. AC466]